MLIDYRGVTVVVNSVGEAIKLMRKLAEKPAEKQRNAESKKTRPTTKHQEFGERNILGLHYNQYRLLRKICRAKLLTSVSKSRAVAKALESGGLVRLTRATSGTLYAKPTAAGRNLINQLQLERNTENARNF